MARPPKQKAGTRPPPGTKALHQPQADIRAYLSGLQRSTSGSVPVATQTFAPNGSDNNNSNVPPTPVHQASTTPQPEFRAISSFLPSTPPEAKSTNPETPRKVDCIDLVSDEEVDPNNDHTPRPFGTPQWRLPVIGRARPDANVNAVSESASTSGEAKVKPLTAGAQTAGSRINNANRPAGSLTAESTSNTERNATTPRDEVSMLEHNKDISPRTPRRKRPLQPDVSTQVSLRQWRQQQNDRSLILKSRTPLARENSAGALEQQKKDGVFVKTILASDRSKNWAPQIQGSVDHSAHHDVDTVMEDVEQIDGNKSLIVKFIFRSKRCRKRFELDVSMRKKQQRQAQQAIIDTANRPVESAFATPQRSTTRQPTELPESPTPRRNVSHQFRKPAIPQSPAAVGQTARGRPVANTASLAGTPAPSQQTSVPPSPRPKRRLESVTVNLSDDSDEDDLPLLPRTVKAPATNYDVEDPMDEDEDELHLSDVTIPDCDSDRDKDYNPDRSETPNDDKIWASERKYRVKEAERVMAVPKPRLNASSSGNTAEAPKSKKAAQPTPIAVKNTQTTKKNAGAKGPAIPRTPPPRKRAASPIATPTAPKKKRRYEDRLGSNKNPVTTPQSPILGRKSNTTSAPNGVFPPRKESRHEGRPSSSTSRPPTFGSLAASQTSNSTWAIDKVLPARAARGTAQGKLKEYAELEAKLNSYTEDEHMAELGTRVDDPAHDAEQCGVMETVEKSVRRMSITPRGQRTTLHPPTGSYTVADWNRDRMNGDRYLAKQKNLSTTTSTTTATVVDTVDEDYDGEQNPEALLNLFRKDRL